MLGWGMLRNITPRSRRRRPRAILKGRAAVYHVVSRCNGRLFLMEEAEEKERFRDLLGRVAAFCGVRLLAYCLMDNHFHVLVEVPKEVGEIDDAELLVRSALIYGGKERLGLPLCMERIRLALKMGGEERDSMRRLLIGRMGSLPMFVKMLKQRYALGFNRIHDRVGTLWEGCYRSVLVEPSREALLAVGAYIDLTPVRAGMVKDPKDYRWSGYGEAAGKGKVESYALLERAWGDEAPGAKPGVKGPVKDARKAASDREKDYRWYLLGEGNVAGGELTRIDVLRCRLRYFTQGVVIGSKAYVDRWFAEHKSWFGRRKKGARPVTGEGGSLLCVISPRS